MKGLLFAALLIVGFICMGLMCGGKLPIYNSQHHIEEVAHSEAFLAYKPGVLQTLIDTKQKALIHLTGDKCIVCKVEWAKVNKVELFEHALKSQYVLYEYNINSEWGQILKEMSPYGVFSVPQYIFVNDKGEVKVLSNISGTQDLIKEMK